MNKLTAAGKLEIILNLLEENTYNEDGEIIGNTKPIITIAEALNLLNCPIEEKDNE